LDILNHKVLTVSVTHEEGTFAVPVYHKESDLDGAEVMKIFGDFLENPDVTKVFHNSNFDLSFWIREGYLPQNIEDTLILAYLENENRPNSLRELTKRYFPDEIEEL
jgi:DNA polymerase I-like protein with 3'-5' exonuclease and polymerase domains